MLKGLEYKCKVYYIKRPKLSNVVFNGYHKDIKYVAINI